MRKHFLILMLMTLLPLVGWAEDYEVQVTTYDGTATWTGAKPDVQPDWFSASFVGGGALTPAQKAIIATGLKVKDVDGRVYNAGTYEYQLALMGGQTINDPGSTDTYKIYLNSSTTATLTITQYTGTYDWTSTSLNAKAELTYNGQAQQLLNGGATATANHSGAAVDVVYALSNTPAATDIFTSYDAVVATNKGDYHIYYRVAETDNYAGTDWYQVTSGSGGTTHLYQATTAAFNVEAVTGLVFNNTDQALLAKTDAEAPIVPFGAEGLQYQIDGGDWTAFTTLDAITGKSAKNGAAYAVKFKIPADASANANWADIESAAINVTIAKATPTFTYVPTHENGGLPSGLVYDGQSHQLVLQEATAIVDGTEISVPLKYSIRRYRNVTGNYTTRTSKPFDQLVGTLASTRYQIRAYNEETNDLNQVIQELENVVIDKATIPADAYTEPGAKNVRTTDALQPLVDAATWTGETTYGTFQYSLNGTDWSTDIPQGTDVAEYTVYWRILPTVVSDTRNYNIVSGNKTSTITAKSKVTITIPANQSFGYGTTPTLEYTATWDAKGSDVLKEEGLTWTWYTGATGDTQASKVGGYYPAGEYYVMVGGLDVDGTTAASQEIVYPTDRQKVKITAGQIVASIGGTAIYGSEPAFTLTHVSGLSAAEAEALNDNSTVLTVTVKKGNDVLVNGDPATDEVKNALKALDAYDSYTLEATAQYDPNTNYTLLVSAGTLKVNPNTAALTIDAIAAVDYKAEKWEPEVTVKSGDNTLTLNTDYTVSYGDDTHDNIKAGEGIVMISGAGNYAGATGSKTFTINKADLIITADNFTGEKAWTYGTVEPTYTATVTGYLDGESFGGTLAGIEGTLKVKRTSNETVGMHTGALVAGFYDADDNKINTPVATNYNLAFNPGDLQVAKGAVAIQLKDAVTATYGDDPATSINAAIKDIASYEYVSGLSELEAANFASFIDVAAATFELTETKPQVGTDYTFAIAGATSTNYAVTISNGTYKVNPSPIKLQAKNQSIDWDANPDATPNTTVSDATVEVITSASDPGLQYGDELTDVIEKINIESTNVDVDNVISLTAKDNKNYSITVLPGVLTVEAAGTLAMTSDYDANDNWFSTIQSYNSQAVTVKLTVNRTQTLLSGKTYTWKGEEWNAFILPFDITPKQLSDAFGYAIVNVVNPSASTADNIAFKLQMSGTIPANTPFMLKNYQAVAPGTVINFGAKTIVAPASKEVSVDAGADWTFIGSYDKKTINNSNSDIYYYNGEGAWKHLGATSGNTWNIAPFNAYLLQPAGNFAREITFTFEELDGSATVIKSVSEESTDTVLEGWYTINGIKLESAPTQKGIYIKDGKKVVIK